MARVTGLEPATSGVTGRHSNQLSYTRVCLGAGPLLRGSHAVNRCSPTARKKSVRRRVVVRIIMGQRAALEQEAGEVRRAGRGQYRL
jgi:hypothetical protein